MRCYADLHGLPEADDRERGDALFDLLDISDVAVRRIGTFSTDMRQKVSMVRTTIHDPDIVAFDEATAGLDALAARSIMPLIRQSRDEGKTVLFSTLRMDEVNMLTDDLGLVDGSEVLHDAPRRLRGRDERRHARGRVHSPN